MKCQCGCGKEIPTNRKKFATVECYHKGHKKFIKQYRHNQDMNVKKQKFACMMCGGMKCKDKYQICNMCKQTETYQNDGYATPCPVHS